jgi:hypothetical protein
VKLAYAFLAAAVVQYFITAIAYPPIDGDLWWQRWLGERILRTGAIPSSLGAETFSAAGAPWIPQEWLFSIGAWLGRSGWGWDFFAGAVACCAVLALWLVALRCVRRGAGPMDTAFCVILTSISFISSYGVRAQVVAWPFFALFCLLLDDDGPALWWSVPVVALWSNLHGSVMVAPVLAGASAVGSLVDSGAFTSLVRRRFFVTGALCAAVIANPLGVRLPRAALSLFGSPIREFIDEWQRTSFSDAAFLIGAFVLLVIIVAYADWVPGRRWREALPTIALVYLALIAVRNESIAGIAFAPLAAPMLSRAGARSGRALPLPLVRPRVLEVGIFVYGVLGAAVLALILWRNPARIDWSRLPVHEISAAAALPGVHRLYCASFSWCSLALDHPNLQVFIDGRTEPFPVSVWQEYVGLRLLKPGWRSDLDRYRIDEVIVDGDGALDQALASLLEWRNVLRDGRFALWVRTSPARHLP